MSKSHRDKTHTALYHCEIGSSSNTDNKLPANRWQDFILTLPDGQNRVHNIVPNQSYSSHMSSLYCLRCKLHFQKLNTENISFTYSLAGLSKKKKKCMKGYNIVYGSRLNQIKINAVKSHNKVHLKGQFSQKFKFCHHFLTLMLFKTWMTIYRMQKRES